MITRKDVEDGNKAMREANHDLMTSLIDELFVEDCSDERKESIVEALEDTMSTKDSWEEENNKFWFQYGKLKGTSIGLFLGAGIFFIGERVGKLIGKLIVSKIES